MRAAGGSPKCYARIAAPVLFDGSVHTANGLATVSAQDSCPSRLQGGGSEGRGQKGDARGRGEEGDQYCNEVSELDAHRAAARAKV